MGFKSVSSQNESSYIGSRHVLPIDNAGLYRKVLAGDEPNSEVVEGKAEFLPMKEINVDAQICDSMSTVKITQVYVNPSNVQPQDKGASKTKPIEISYKFPKIAEQIIAGMKVSIGGKTIEANILEKEKAQDKYDDAVASGNQAAIMKETKGEFLELQIGNINPGQEATIEITIVQQLESTNGAFVFDFPLTYFPQYEKVKDDKILFNFRANLKSTNSGFSEIAHPNNFEILDQKIDSATVQKINSDYHEVKEDLKISFRLQNMDDTRLLFQKSDKYPGQVAVMASFHPTFTSVANTDKVAVTAGLLEEQDLPTELESKYQFIFLIDRSGSMGCNNRMQITNDAVILFLQSLPGGCKFGMLGFGSNCTWCTGGINDYNNQTKDIAINEAKQFDSNYGGTDILSPLVTASTLESGEYKKRIFVLTDGQVSNKQEIINFCESMCAKNDDTKVFTFGIGNGCDEDLVKRVATAGRGSHSIVGDNNPAELKTKVINALRKASDPALQNCSFDMGNQNFKLGELYRNQAVRCCTLMTQDSFDKLNCTFKSEYDPKTKASLTQSLTKESFKEFVSSDDSLFKLCAKAEIDKTTTSNAEKIKLSIKYQVLCSETSFIGVVKNKNKKVEEMKKVEIQAINYNNVPVKKPVSSYGMPDRYSASYGSSVSYGSARRNGSSRGMRQEPEREQSRGSMMMCNSSARPKKSSGMKISNPFSGISNPFAGMSLPSRSKAQNQDAAPMSKSLAKKSSKKDKSKRFEESKLSDLRSYGEIEKCAYGAMESSNDGALNNIIERSSIKESISKSRSKYKASRQTYAQEELGLAYDSYAQEESAMSYGSSSIGYGMAMNACMSSAQSAPSGPQKPSFQSFISSQDSIGFWGTNSTSRIFEFFNSTYDVQKLIDANKEIENIILTMLAILILENQFSTQKSEWDMICSKAKKWIRQQNLDADRKKDLEDKTKGFGFTSFDQYGEEDDMQRRLDALMNM